MDAGSLSVIEFNNFIEKQEKSLVNIEKIGLIDAIYLISVIKALYNYQLDALEPLRFLGRKLTPHLDFSCQLMDELHFKSLIYIHSLSSQSLFYFNEKNDSIHYDTSQVLFGIDFGKSISERLENIHLLQEKARRLLSHSYGSEKYDKVLKIMKDLALYECIEYLLFQCSLYKFEYIITERVKDEFNYLITLLPVCKIFSLIWAAVKNANSFYLTPQCENTNHAMNTIILNIIKYSKNKYPSKKFDRLPELPRCALSQVLYQDILGIGDFGFYENIFNLPVSYFDKLDG